MDEKKRRKVKTKYQLQNAASSTAFVAPALILICIAIIIPFCMNLIYSFTSWNGISSEMNFIGFRNYIQLFRDSEFWGGTVSFTMRFAVFYVVIVNVFALCMAVLLTKKIRSANVLRAFLYVPQLISLIMVGYVWKFILGNGFNDLYSKTGWGIFHLSWLGSRTLAFWVIVFLTVWQQAGFYAVIYIAGIQSLPSDVMEAAEIDGASGPKKFFKVTFPLLMPSVSVCLFTSILNAFKIYDLPFVLTAGGPSASTKSIAMDIYDNAFRNNLYGYATTKSVVYFVMVVVCTLIVLGITKKREVEA